MTEAADRVLSKFVREGGFDEADRFAMAESLFNEVWKLSPANPDIRSAHH